jgi:hypothetical protein
MMFSQNFCLFANEGEKKVYGKEKQLYLPTHDEPFFELLSFPKKRKNTLYDSLD